MIEKSNNISVVTLSNGMRLVHEESSSNVAYLGVILNTGSRDEGEMEQGVAHFMEHLAFKGTTKRKAFHIISRMEDVGGDINAYTTKEETAIYSLFLSQYYDRAVELLKDIIFNSTFPVKEIEREKEVIIDEINSYKDSPSELIYDDFEDQIFKGQPLGRNILGTAEQINTYNRDNFTSFRDRCYNTDNMVISSSGNISIEKLKTIVERYFQDIPTNTRSYKREPFKGYKSSFKELKKETYQGHTIIGSTAYDIHHPQRLTLVLLNNILAGSSMSSRLNMSLREKNGLAYTIDSNYTPYSDTGVLNIYFGTDHANIDRAIELVHKELKRLRTEKLGPVQLSKAKRQFQGQIALSRENREDLMLSMGRSILFFNKIPNDDNISKRVEKLSSEDLMSVANEIFHPDNLSTLIYR